jgi:hypothetical protein
MNPPNHRGKRVIKINAISFAKLCRLMQPGIYTMDQLAEKTGLHKVTVMHYARELHREEVCHIAQYAPDSLGRKNAIVYRLGVGKDAERVSKSNAENARNYRLRKKGLLDKPKAKTAWA